MTLRWRIGVPVVTVLFGVVALGPALPADATSVTWTQVGAGSVNNISGLAASSTGWVAIRDNKKVGQNRISLVSTSGVATPLTWPGALPSDLESIDRVPGASGTYATLASTGQGYVVQIAGATVSLLATFVLPNAKSGVEAFALTTLGSATVAVWATRGSTTAPARVSTATFTPSTGAFGKIKTGPVSVPYPTTDVRQISDLKVLAGRLIISSTSDPGDNGPFTSALYDVGTVSLSGARAVLGLTVPRELGEFPGHKVEGIACSATNDGELGSDDEKGGGWIASFSFCGP